MIARAMGLPSSGLRVPVTVRTKWQGNRILWTRDFNGKLLLTTQRIEENLIVERQGPFSLHLSMRATDASLKLRRVGLRFLGIPIPMVFGPHVLARVSAGSSEGAWKVDVKSIHFGYGFVGRYRGEMNSH